MSNTHPSGYRIGAPTTTIDGKRGTVSALIIDRRTRAVTRLAVNPAHQHRRARLVPIAMATAEPSGDVQLAYSYERFCRLDELDELDVVDIGSSWRYGAGRLRNSINDVEQGWAWTDRKPDDEAALRSGTPVRVGGAIVGHVDGLIAGFDEHITAVLVACGHLWSRRTIAVPVDALTSVDSTGVTIADRWGLRAPRRGA